VLEALLGVQGHGREPRFVSSHGERREREEGLLEGEDGREEEEGLLEGEVSLRLS
jgi:hypothetical protein